jgi:hypothetical protein
MKGLNLVFIVNVAKMTLIKTLNPIVIIIINNNNIIISSSNNNNNKNRVWGLGLIIIIVEIRKR